MSLSELQRRYRAAKSRALYWSGNPSYSGHRFKPGAGRLLGGHDEQYELAMCDLDSLSDAIVDAGGARPKPYDPKQAWRAAYAKLASALNH